jgi:CRP/FNR family transcriptional regulator
VLNNADVNDLSTHYPFLHHLPANLQQTLLQVGNRKHISTGQIYFDIGMPCHDFTLFLTGNIRVIKPTPTGQEILLYRVFPGDTCILTINCLVNHTNYQASGIVEEDISAITIPYPFFNQLIEQAPIFHKFIFNSLGQQINQLITLVEELAFQKLDQRLATRLLQNGPHVKATHQMLADELGSAREVVTRLLQEFKQQGTVSLKRGHIYVIDSNALKRIADTDS